MYMPEQRSWGQAFPCLMSMAMDVFPNLYCVPGVKSWLQEGITGTGQEDKYICVSYIFHPCH